jgi:hypothetical protein
LLPGVTPTAGEFLWKWPEGGKHSFSISLSFQLETAVARDGTCALKFLRASASIKWRFKV